MKPIDLKNHVPADQRPEIPRDYARPPFEKGYIDEPIEWSDGWLDLVPALVVLGCAFGAGIFTGIAVLELVFG